LIFIKAVKFEASLIIWAQFNFTFVSEDHLVETANVTFDLMNEVRKKLE
jgi:hypothetical protein